MSKPDSLKNLKFNSPEAIAAAWDNLCDTYCNDLLDVSKRKALTAVELAVIRKEFGNRRGLRILDVGCGPGWHGIELARDGHQLVMADLSVKMLEKVQAAVETAGLQNQITICRSDIRSLPLESSSFDAIISCGTVVSDCGNPDAALAEFSRLLKTNGIAMFSVRNLLAFLDQDSESVNPYKSKQWISSGRRVIPQGHQAFDWTLFTVGGLRNACSAAQLTLRQVYPVGLAAPPQDDAKLSAYVECHIDQVDKDSALAKSHELFAVAVKPG